MIVHEYTVGQIAVKETSPRKKYQAKALEPIHDQACRSCFFDSSIWRIQIPKTLVLPLIRHIPASKEVLFDQHLPFQCKHLLFQQQIHPSGRMELRSDRKDWAPKTTSIARFTTCYASVQSCSQHDAACQKICCNVLFRMFSQTFAASLVSTGNFMELPPFSPNIPTCSRLACLVGISLEFIAMRVCGPV